MNQNKVRKLISYFALFVIVNWDALHAYIFKSSGTGYILFYVSILLIFNEAMYTSFWRTLFKKPYILWFLWIVYALINTFIINTYQASTSPLGFAFGVVLPIIIILTIANKRYSYLELVNLFILSFFFRAILSLTFDSFVFNDTDYVTRLGEIFNANEIAFGAYFLIVLLGMKNILYKKLDKINYIQLIIGITIVVLTASRKVTLALMLLFIGYVYIYRSNNVIKRYFKYFLFLILGLLISSLMIESTDVGKRIVGVFERTKYASSAEDTFDSRGGQYVKAVEMFRVKPINGVGLYNFSRTGRAYRTAHSEYLVQLVECGLIGVMLSLLFYRFIISQLLKKRRLAISLEDRRVNEFFIVFILTVFFIMLGSWMYNRAIYWVIIGIIVKYINENKFPKKRYR